MKDFETRKYIIKLKKNGLKAPSNERSKRAIVTIKQFIEKNTRAKKGDVLIGEELNNAIWNRGIKNPPTKVSVFVQKLKSGKAFVNLEGKPLRIEFEKKADKKDKKKEKSLEDLTAESKTDDNVKADKKEEINSTKKVKDEAIKKPVAKFDKNLNKL
ncbi:MAG: 50S ribosomal protein L31e [Candidatus Nanoarchaeia archaeon]